MFLSLNLLPMYFITKSQGNRPAWPEKFLLDCLFIAKHSPGSVETFVILSHEHIKYLISHKGRKSPTSYVHLKC